MSGISGIKFRPVMGTEDIIKNTGQSNGWLYVATDTGNMYLDVNNHRIAIGGQGGSGGSGSTGFVWASADEEAGTIVKATDNYSDGDPVYYLNPSAIEGGVVPKVDSLILNSDGRFFRVTDTTSPVEGMITVELIAVSGGGSGGGGGGTSDIDLTLDWSGINLLSSTFIHGKDAEIAFMPNSLVDESYTFTVSVKEASTNREVYNRVFNKLNGERCIVNAKDFPVSDSLIMNVTLISDHSTYDRGRGLTKSFKGIKVVELYLKKPADVDMIPVQKGSASLSYTPVFDGLLTRNEQNNLILPYTMKTYYSVGFDGDAIQADTVEASYNNDKKYITVPHQGHGVYLVNIWLNVEINGQEYTSNTISYEVPFAIDENEDPIIWIKDELGSITKYEPAVVQYMVYSSVAARTGSSVELQFLQDGVLFDSAEVEYNSTRWYNLDLTSKYVEGENHFSIVSGGVRKDIDFTIVTTGARSLEVISDNIEIDFDAIGRSNKQIKSNRINFVSSAIPSKIRDSLGAPVPPLVANLNNFNWYNNGWLNDNDGNGSYLAVSNGASVSIPMPAITINAASDPWTFEMRFRIRNAKKFATLVTEIPIYVWRNKTTGEECASGEELPLDEIEAKGENFEPVRDGDGNLVMNEKNTTRKITRADKYIAFRYLNNDNKGFAIGSQEAYFNVGGRVVNVKYRENEIINISFVIDKSKNQLSIYLNGILSGVGDLSGISGFSMLDTPFTINSDYCDFDLYKFRAYSSALTMPNVIHNYISDMKNIDLYDENQLAVSSDIEGSTRLSYNKMIAFNESHPDSPIMPYVVIDMSGETSTGNTELPFSKTAKGIDGTRIEFTNPTGDHELQLWMDEAIETTNGVTKRLGITPYEYYTHCPSYTANNVNINVQGTSSQIYPRRNFKTKFKKAKQWIYTFGPLANCPVNYSYYFESDGELATALLQPSLEIQNEIAELDAIKNPSAEQKARKSELKAQLKTLGTGKVSLTKNWHEDSEEFGSNKFTWKIDYMESSGSYNTGFANLMGNKVYNKHPLEDIGLAGEDTEYRTSVYGFPMLAFHKTAENTYTYIGRYNCNLDKSANERYGFELEKAQPNITNLDGTHPLVADIAECWELRDNQGSWCSFRYPTSARELKFRTPISQDDIGIEVVKHFEARYHKYGDQFEWGQNEILGKENNEDFSAEVGTDKATINSYLLDKLKNLEVLVTWLDSTDTGAATNEPLTDDQGQPITVKYKVSNVDTEHATANGVVYSVEQIDGVDVNMGTFSIDSAEYRRQKFYNEFDLHLDKHYCAVYFVMTELLLCYDSRGKNMMIASWGPTANSQGNFVWYPIFYDIDTQLGLNNVGAQLWGYDENCTENGTFSTAQSVLWTNFNDLFKSQIISTYRILRGSGDDGTLSYKNIEGAYNCDPAVFKRSTAMRGRRPILAMGLDEYYKYVLPVSEPWRNQKGDMITANYLYACQGDRKLSRELLINNRLLYMDSKWLGGEFTISSGGMAGIMFRSTANHETSTSDKYIDIKVPGALQPGDTYTMTTEDDQGNQVSHTYEYQPYGVKKYIDATPQYLVTPYLNFYITTFVDENTFKNDEAYNEDRFPNGQPTKVLDSVTEAYQYGRVDQQLNYFAGSSYISSLGDLSTKYANQVKIPNTPRLLDITLGSDDPEYFNNENLNPFELYCDYDDAKGAIKEGSEKPLLSKIVLSNLRGLNVFQDIRSPEKLEEFRALGTSLPYALFADGAPLNTVHLPATTTMIRFVQNKSLTKLLTSAPQVIEMNGNQAAYDQNGNLIYKPHASYEGLYIAGVTDYVDSLENRGQGSPVTEIDIEGDALGYGSYIILNNLVLQKKVPDGSGRNNRLSIKMADVNWTPYTQVEYGEEKQDGVTYYKLTDHSTYELYSSPGSEWANDTLNGKVFTFDATAPKATISDLSLLDTFLEDYADTSTTINQFTNNVESEISRKTYPALSGQIFVANGSAEVGISETRISQVYGVAWPNLVIRAEKVETSYLTKYVEIDPNSHKEVVLDNKAFSDTDTISLPPRSRLKVPTRTHYDFIGFSPVHPDEYTSSSPLYVVDNAVGTDWTTTEAGAAAHIDANTKTQILYAIFVPTAYQITYVFDSNDRTKDQVVDSYYGSPIAQPSDVPYKDESQLPLEQKYAFLGWGYNADSISPVNMANVNVNRNMTFFAIFNRVNVHSNPLSDEYLTFTYYGQLVDRNNVEVPGYAVGLNTNYALKGKITLPTMHDGLPVVAIARSATDNTQNGFSHDNDGKNAITHVFWDNPDNAQVLEILPFAFRSSTTKYVELPASLHFLGTSCFSEAACENIFNELDQINTFYDNVFNTAHVNISEIYLDMDGHQIEQIRGGAFSYIQSLNSIQIGSEGHPARITTLRSSAFCPYYNDHPYTITIYTDDINNQWWTAAHLGDGNANITIVPTTGN